MQHAPACHLKCREQVGLAVALVIVRLVFGQTWPNLQQRTRPVEGLNLRFLVHANHQAALRRSHVEPHNVNNFLLELRVFAQLEAPNFVRLQVVPLPHLEDQTRRHAQPRGQATNAPMRRTRRRATRGLNDLPLQLGGNRLGSTTARTVSINAFNALNQEPIAPLCNSVSTGFETPSDFLVL